MITSSTTSCAESPIRLALLAVDIQRNAGIIEVLRNIDAAHVGHGLDLRGQLLGERISAAHVVGTDLDVDGSRAGPG